MKHELVTVLDLGSTKVNCLAARADGGDGMKIEAFATAPCKGMKRGAVTDLDATFQAIDAAVRETIRQTGTEVESVIVGVTGPGVEGINAQGYKPIVPRGRHITHQDVLEVINHSRSVVLPPDQEQIQALPREFRVDGQRDVKKPIGMSGTKLEVVTYVVTGQTTQLQNLEKAVQMAGRRVDQMVLGPLASGIGVLTQEEMELGAAVVDIGGGNTDIAIFVKGSLAHCASLPIGGQLVSSDLSKLLKTSPEEADRLKKTFGSSYAKLVPEGETVEVQQIGQSAARPLQRRVLCEIIESRMREIGTMVKQQLDKSGLAAVLPGGVVLTGGGARLTGVDKLFEDSLKHLRVRSAEPSIPAVAGADSGLAASVGLARFAIQCYDELAPATGVLPWRDKVRSLFSMLSGKA